MSLIGGMGASEDLARIKLALDTRDFEFPLREAGASTERFAKKTGETFQRTGRDATGLARDARGLAGAMADLGRSGADTELVLSRLSFEAGQLGGGIGNKFLTNIGLWGSALAAAAAAGWQLGSALEKIPIVARTADVAVDAIMRGVGRFIPAVGEMVKQTERAAVLTRVAALEAAGFTGPAAALATGAPPPGAPPPPPGGRGGPATLRGEMIFSEEENRRRLATAADLAAMATPTRAISAEDIFPDAAGAEERLTQFRETTLDEFIQGVREDLTALGIEPEEREGLLDTLVSMESAEAVVERMDLVTAKITGDLRAIGDMAKSSAAAGFEAFFHSIFAGQGAAAAFRALTKTILDGLANQAIGKGAMALADALWMAAWGNWTGAGLAFKSAATYLTIGGIAKGLGAVAGGGGGGGGFAGATGEGGGGGFRPRGGDGFAPSPLDREPRQTTVILQVEGARLGSAVIGSIEAAERESGRRRLR